jgi:tryptophan synthase alpha chain
MNKRIQSLFTGSEKVLSVFVTAGFPRLEDTLPICETLAESGVKLIELGAPFSDSIADGPTIQAANETALANGANLAWALATAQRFRARYDARLILMGSFNPLLQYGMERFCADAQEAGVDGVIAPDLPPAYYLQNYREMFEQRALANIFLVTEQTPAARLRQIDEASQGFIYAVSSAGVTGGSLAIDAPRRDYLQQLRAQVKAPLMVGFGISNRAQFQAVTQYADGAIVGSAFVRALARAADVRQTTAEFIRQLSPSFPAAI